MEKMANTTPERAATGRLLHSFIVVAGVAALFLMAGRRAGQPPPNIQMASEIQRVVKGTLRQLFFKGTIPEVSPLSLPAGTRGLFVTLSVRGRVRGCSGTLHLSSSNPAREVVSHTIIAATQDPRYPPLLPSEVPLAKSSVTLVLSPPREVTSLDFFHPAYQGVLFKAKGRTLLFLPGERRFPGTLLEEARQTFRLDPSEKISIFVFQAIRIGGDL